MEKVESTPVKTKSKDLRDISAWEGPLSEMPKLKRQHAWQQNSAN